MPSIIWFMVFKKDTYRTLMSMLTGCIKFIKNNLLLVPALLMPVIIFAFTLGRYYGFYYDNHYFNLLALDEMQAFRPYLYIGSHYSIHSALYAYLALPFFYIFGPTDFSMEFVSALFHLATIILCFRLGFRFFNRILGLIFAYLVALAPIYLINIYTWTEYGLIGFLNIAAIYYYVCALEEDSIKKAALSAILYSASCLQAIYSLPLLLFFALFFLLFPLIGHRAVIASPERSEGRSNLNQDCFVAKNAPRNDCYGRWRWREAVIFFGIVAAILIAAELFVQLDMNFFGQRFGYYRNTLYSGGFGTARPFFVVHGAPVKLFGRPLYLSVLTSIFAFSSGYAKVALNFAESAKIISSYYQQCFPLVVNLFFLAGVAGLLFEIARKIKKRERLDIKQVLPLAWVVAATLSFINVYPYHILRIHILPMPYLLAAMGVNYIAGLSAYVYQRPRYVKTLSLIILTLYLCVEQYRYSVNLIYRKYKSDKAASNYYKLYHGWPYGRSYKEVGEFLLKDAPLKIDGKSRSIFVHTISPYTAVNICALFFNTIDWYTQEKIKIIYDDIETSYNKYGSPDSLKRYLSGLFFDYPEVEVVYFADFLDRGDNFSFFSKVHPDIKAYKIVDDDGVLNYDCLLYKFERKNWSSQIK